MSIINECYKRVYVNDMIGSTATVGGKAIVNSDYMGGDSIEIKDIGIKKDDVFGNEFYNIDRYARTKLDNTPGDPHQDFLRTTFERTYSPRADYPGFDYICLPCSTSGPISTPPGTSPASCAVFVKDAKEWDRKTIDRVVVSPGSTVTNSEGIEVKGPEPYVARTFGEYNNNGDWVTEIFINDCTPRNPFTVLVPEPAGNLDFVYMNGEFILTIEGERITSAPNTTILVAEEGNV